MTSVNLSKEHPAVYQSVVALEESIQQAAKAASIDPKLVQLVKIRVSQINGCAFCLRMHTREAIELGETTDRLAVIAAWWESQYFSEEEQAALALAEEVTQQSQRPQPKRYAEVFTPEQQSAITWLAIIMNTWNRIAVHSHYPVKP
ncbi:carboxymuconolactone decarboxylase family protein [Corynebacterium glutamicum]|uniref:carboxymuconolactone decarboxylase family protein n=1 Tax=Corynebacterium glutamicum TaxID=1718 RepID=UPI000744C86A|nr:carboxymuconolactone decarboxylase family protein [Corynebacterium glutamicum]ALZ98815.1 alkylhydroperoxidase [Corynebacterium glutamicum]